MPTHDTRKVSGNGFMASDITTRVAHLNGAFFT
jgi:hypothetical protein